MRAVPRLYIHVGFIKHSLIILASITPRKKCTTALRGNKVYLLVVCELVRPG